MKQLEAVLAFLKALLIGVGLFFIRQGGKDAEKAKQAEDQREANHEAEKIHDAVDSDPDFNDRVRDRFNR